MKTFSERAFPAGSGSMTMLLIPDDFASCTSTDS